MKTYKNNILRLASILSLCAWLPMSLAAQNDESAYFLEGNLYRYQMNPAIANTQNFFAIPALGNVNAELTGNLGLENILYNVNGKTTTFLNSGVSAAEFMDNIKDTNNINADTKIGILAFGFKGFHGYNNITLNFRTNVGVKLPGELFSLLKNGVENSSYDLSDVGANATAWAELGFGHSHKINDKLSIGANLKFLFGAGNIDAKFNKANLQLTDNSWNIIADAELHTSIKGLNYERSYNRHTNRQYVSGMDIDGAGLGGFGLAVDLGAEYKINSDWNVGLSITDLGAIRWSNDVVASTNGEQSVKTDDYTFNADKNANNSFSNEWSEIRDKISLIYQLQDMGDTGSRTTALGATMYAAVDYTLPTYRKLKFGLLNSTRFQGDYTWTNFRLSANISPIKQISAGVNYALGTYGNSFGWIIDFHPKFINIFVSQDNMFTKIAKQGVPLSSNSSLNLGINVPF